jgi:hypothetical protein
MVWRLKTPEIKGSLATFAIAAVLAVLAFQYGLVKLNEKSEADFSGQVPAWVSLIASAAIVLWPLLRSVIPAVSASLFPGTPDAAKNFSLGSGDPLERFREHFASSMRRAKHPVLVVIDDLDRCKPEFVVDLVRGMQTIFKSERVVFLLLGDRDWITEAFTVVNEKMKAIEVGAEHEFGERFVEKAIQFSFVLPEPKPDEQRRYVEKLLRRGETAPAPSDDLADVASEIAEAEKEADFEIQQRRFEDIGVSARKRGIAPDVIESLVRSANLRSGASAAKAEAAVRHHLEGLAHVLPPNPRQVKRIFNTIGYLQLIAAYPFGGEDWQKLARWITLMVEWPRSWFTLSRSPELISEVYKAKTEDAEAKLIRGNADALALLDFKPMVGNKHWRKTRIVQRDIEKFARLLPAASGKRWVEKE